MQKLLAMSFAVLSSFGASAHAAELCKSAYSTELAKLSQAENDDWASVAKNPRGVIATAVRDQARRKRVDEIQKAGGLCSAEDFLAAAIVMSHGVFVVEDIKAIKFASTALALDPTLTQANQPFRVAIDQIAVRARGDQLYGTVIETKNGVDMPVPVMPGFIPND